MLTIKEDYAESLFSIQYGIKLVHEVPSQLFSVIN